MSQLPGILQAQCYNYVSPRVGVLSPLFSTVSLHRRDQDKQSEQSRPGLDDVLQPFTARTRRLIGPTYVSRIWGGIIQLEIIYRVLRASSKEQPWGLRLKFTDSVS